MIRPAALALTLACCAAGAAAAAPPPPTPSAVAVFKEKGAYVLRESGASMPLYTYDRDPAGKSACTGACTTAWPPLAAGLDSTPVGDWSMIKRDDGTAQWAWRAKPVYTYAKDGPEKPTGDGVGGVWRLLPTLPAN